MARRILPLETRLLVYPLLAIAPSYVVAVLFVWTLPYSATIKWTGSVMLLVPAVASITSLRRSVAFSVGTVSNVIASLRNGEFAVRARRVQQTGPFGELLSEVNLFGESLQKQRLDSVESTALLSKILEEIDVAVFGFDGKQRLRLCNRRAEALCGRDAKMIMGQTAPELALNAWLSGESPRIVNVDFGGRTGRWELRRGYYRERGERHCLLFLSDLTPALREEERQAWQRLLQVLRHELNNSLTPIQSLAASLLSNVDATRASSHDVELVEGLEIILNRARSLSRFMGSYARLSSLPKPSLGVIKVGDLIRNVVGLEPRLQVQIHSSPDIEIQADAAQLEQVLINLVRNAVEAALETQGTVIVSWTPFRNRVEMIEIQIEDTGLGIANPQNLFVPFYTTKPDGSGIGLVLSRQIIEAHGGTLILENREDTSGCRARVRLPVRHWDA